MAEPKKLSRDQKRKQVGKRPPTATIRAIRTKRRADKAKRQGLAPGSNDVAKTTQKNGKPRGTRRDIYTDVEVSGGKFTPRDLTNKQLKKTIASKTKAGKSVTKSTKELATRVSSAGKRRAATATNKKTVAKKPSASSSKEALTAKRMEARRSGGVSGPNYSPYLPKSSDGKRMALTKMLKKASKEKHDKTRHQSTKLIKKQLSNLKKGKPVTKPRTDKYIGRRNGNGGYVLKSDPNLSGKPSAKKKTTIAKKSTASSGTKVYAGGSKSFNERTGRYQKPAVAKKPSTTTTTTKKKTTVAKKPSAAVKKETTGAKKTSATSRNKYNKYNYKMYGT